MVYGVGGWVSIRCGWVGIFSYSIAQLSRRVTCKTSLTKTNLTPNFTTPIHPILPNNMCGELCFLSNALVDVVSLIGHALRQVKYWLPHQNKTPSFHNERTYHIIVSPPRTNPNQSLMEANSKIQLTRKTNKFERGLYNHHTLLQQSTIFCHSKKSKSKSK